MAYTKACVFAVLMMALLGFTMGAQVYLVGDGAGWNNQGTDYKLWSTDKNFRIGDTIVFNYNPQLHNVLEVSKQDFEACSTSAPMATYTGGRNGVQLLASGTYYFICGFPGMCRDGGQKIEINVLSSNAGTNSTNPTPQGSNFRPGYPGVYYSASSTLSLNFQLVLLMIMASHFLAFYLH